MRSVRVALAQINPTVGDLSGNARKIISYIKRARRMEADIVAFPELAVTGYPPEDLLLKPRFIHDNIRAMEKIRNASTGIVSVVGFVDVNESLYNAAAVISNGEIVDVYHKKHLPNYGVFDEYRYFHPDDTYPVYRIAGVKTGINVCEDIWYEKGPARVQALSGAQLIININASPYHMGKARFREKHISALALQNDVAIVYLNTVGGQDELVFDGGSFVVNSRGEILTHGKQFREELIVTDIEVNPRKRKPSRKEIMELRTIVGKKGSVEEIKTGPARPDGGKRVLKERRLKRIPPEEEVYSALVTGTGDYMKKNGFKGVVVGMSGGVDSALVTTIAVDALGKDHVHGLFMPSAYTSRESREDAFGLAHNLGIEITNIPIGKIYDSYLKTLSEHFRGMPPDITEENLQARIRGNLTMAFSNKYGWLVLTTGNKSEMSVGYATLYGDMAGGFAVIKDVPKMLVYKLCEWRNHKAGRDLIPDRVLWKEPTAELRPDQRDTDSLPPYPLLDPILKAYVEDDLDFSEIMKMGCDVECAKKVISMVDHSEYKRRQAPPGIKITPRAFGKDRRFPITNRYKSY